MNQECIEKSEEMNMRKEKILSISIAAYNVEKTLRECLNPFIASGVIERLDIMIVDDGSKDNTAQIAMEYVEKYPQSIRLINKKNGGWGSTVNMGIQEAVGEFFRQLDGDDYYNSENMNDYIRFLSSTSADMVLAPYIEFCDDTGETLAEPNCNPGCEIGKVYTIRDIGCITPFMHSMTIRTDILKKKVRITEHCFYTDTEFVLKGCNSVDTVAFFDKSIYCYRRASAGQSMSLTGLEKHYMDQTKVIDVMLDYLQNEVSREDVRNIYDKLLFNTCVWQYCVMLYISPSSKHKRDLVAFDKMLKKKHPKYYDSIAIPTIKALRKTGFLGYRFAAYYQQKHDKRFDKEGRILY